MGRRGPPKKPVELRVLDGSYRPGRDGPAPSSDRLEALPPAPKHIGKRGKEVWKTSGEYLVRNKMLGAGDVDTLRRLCELEDELEETREQERKEGAYQLSDKGHWSMCPWVTRRYKIIEAQIRCWQHLGLTPAARASCRVAEASRNKATGVSRRDRGADKKNA